MSGTGRSKRAVRFYGHKQKIVLSRHVFLLQQQMLLEKIGVYFLSLIVSLFD